MNKLQSDELPEPREISATAQPQETLDVRPSVAGLVGGESAQPALDLQAAVAAQRAVTAHPVGDITIDQADPALDVPAKKRHFRPHLRPVRMPTKVHTFDSFQFRNYRVLWSTTLFSSGGFWLQQVVIGWLTYQMTQSAFLTTLAMGLDALPLLIAGPIGGMLVDSRDRTKLLAYIFAYQAAVTFAFGIVVVLGLLETWHIFAFIITMGFAWVVLDPARMSLIATTVPKKNLVNAFALNSLAFSVMRLAAPAAGGLMIVTIGPGPTLLAEAIMHLVAFKVALGLDLPKIEPKKFRFSSAIAGTLEAARYVKGQPVILGLMLFGILPPLVVLPFAHGLIPVYAAEVFHVGPTGLGVLMASVGAGATIGMVVLASLGEVRNKGMLSIASLALTALTMVALSRANSPVMAFPVFMALSVSVMVFMSTTNATIQSIVPDEFRGRVSALYVMTFGLMPVGSLLAGVLAQTLGAPNTTLIASGVLALLLTMLAFRFRSVWRPE